MHTKQATRYIGSHIPAADYDTMNLLIRDGGFRAGKNISWLINRYVRDGIARDMAVAAQKISVQNGRHTEPALQRGASAI